MYNGQSQFQSLPKKRENKSNTVLILHKRLAKRLHFKDIMIRKR